MLRDYIIRLCAVAVLSLAAKMLLPDGALRRTATFCLSLVFTVVLLAPVAQMLASPEEIFQMPAATDSAAAQQDRQVVLASAQSAAGRHVTVTDVRYENGVLTGIVVQAAPERRDEARRALALRFGSRVEIIFEEVEP